MIRKIYSLLCIISLIVALPAFGMETYPCDVCEKEKTIFNYIRIDYSKSKKCDHIVCKECDNVIDNSEYGPIEISTASPCAHCNYMRRIKNKQCCQIEHSSIKTSDGGITDKQGLSAEYFKINFPNRFLPNITDTNKVDITKKEQNTSRCDCCTTTITHKDLIHTDHTLNKLEGSCSYILCDTCQNEIDTLIDVNTISPLFNGCKVCNYFDTFGLEKKWNPITYPCDNCKQEYTSLISTKNFWDNKSGLKCCHILCQHCQDTFNWKKIKNDQIWWNCLLCSYFYHHHNQQCWQLDQKVGLLDGVTTMRAKGLKIGYPNRVLPNITTTTILPRHTRDSQNNTNNQQNTNNIPSNPNDPHQQTNNFVIDNKLQWLGIAGLGTVVCYGAYKAYHWWKAQYKKENNDEIDELDNQTREGVETLEV